MYEYLKGLVTAVNPYYVVLEVQGIGYQLQVANPYRYTESMSEVFKFMSTKQYAILILRFLVFTT